MFNTAEFNIANDGSTAVTGQLQELIDPAEDYHFDEEQDGVRVPVFLRQDDLSRVYPDMEAIPPRQCGNITIRNVKAENTSPQGCYFIGLPEMPFENVILENSQFSFEPAPDESWLDIHVPDNRKIHTSMEASGNFPCYGLFARYINGLTLRNVKFHASGNDPRPAVQYQKCSKVLLDNIY